MMLPSVMAGELERAVHDFLRSAFPITTAFFQRAETGEPGPHALIDALMHTPGRVFKGPYLDIRLPFRVATAAALPFRHLTVSFAPYQHQLMAFRRLTGDAPRATLVATGTGSGKTECFMLPILDACLAHRERGIKAIVIYPMNALAADQARRFAREVAKQDTRLSVGLFVGGEQKDALVAMGPDNVITQHESLRRNPPDILLTNYKMLDFLLIRPKDRPLWRFNEPGRLRYLVVDELHTFDGAQGTDLACLIRRLRDRLDAGPELACVGTSATLGADAATALTQYASDVFATPFDREAVITEDRLTADEYLQGHVAAATREQGESGAVFGWPDGRDDALNPDRYAQQGAYLQAQVARWFAGIPADALPALAADSPRARAEAAVRLGDLLHRHPAFHVLIRAACRLTDARALAASWQQKLALDDSAQALRLLASLIALVSAARRWRDQDSARAEDWCQPLLDVREQLWLRELRRMVCLVPATAGGVPELAFADDLRDPAALRGAGSDDGALSRQYLPLLHCRNCHLAAWGAVQRHGDSHLESDLQTFYQAWFGHSPQARLLVPEAATEGNTDNARPLRGFCPHCLLVQALDPARQCRECGRTSVQPVWVPDMVRDARRDGDKQPVGHHDCPACGARESLAVVGYRAATLTSVMAGRLFNTPYNDDYKLIAFSDSVQDAAHRAGFLGSNTWRQVVRQAMASWLHQQQGAVSLRDMRAQLPAWWRQELASDASFCGLFIAPDMEWLRDYMALVRDNHLPAGSDLAELVTKRLAWECVAEFGLRAGVGRSLERTRVAGITWDGTKLRADVARLAARLREEVQALRAVDDRVFEHFVVGWLHHLRHAGAIYDPFLDGYLRDKGSEYVLNQKMKWMPNFGRSRRPPAAATLGHVAENFEALVLTHRETWAVHWLKKSLARDAVFAAAEARQIFTLCVRALARDGWLVEREAAGESLYLLNPESLFVSTHCVQLACDRCGQRHVVGETARELYAGAPCLRKGCLGTLGEDTDHAEGMHHDYGDVAPRRLVPHEHTGLLERDVRERVERSFISGSRPWDVNLLSATPTLEMGIDIGELSSVLLCSVPPTQANYLQRIGRAGRRDGNALAVTVASGRSHDLYFDANPLEMMAGQVRTPGVFLQATAVLERQLLAYCFDRWVAGGVDASAIPGEMGKVLDAVEGQQQDRFPYNLLAFVNANHAAILSAFFTCFTELDDAAREHLQAFIRPAGEASLAPRMVDRLQELVNERKSLKKKASQLKAELARLKQQPDDEHLRELYKAVDDERTALLSLVASTNRHLTLNFFTDEGLLPNYAFPEAGVTLRSVILRRLSEEQAAGSGPRYEKLALTLQRPAQAALSELAPESRFYAVSHKLPIDRIDLGTSEDTSRKEEWRFCNRCQYTERVDTGDRNSVCPRCGSGQWADSGQKHAVLKLRQVYSTVRDRDSRIGDDSEQREPAFFRRQMLVDVDPGDSRGGFRIVSDTLPFGFEFLRRVTLREVNFGAMGGQSHHFTVAGKEHSRPGFRLCSHCGKVQKAYWRRGERPHDFTCKLYQHPEQATPEDFFDSLYLYRELTSEAIRILLPLSEVAYSEEKLHSFVAALNLGLKLYFHGDVHHLEVTEMREPDRAGSGEKTYLVLYDRIPGGTGYLKDLMRNPEHVQRVFALALQHMNACACVDDETRDGCYRCILAYRDSRNMAAISRRAAVKLLQEILDQWAKLEKVDQLSGISVNALSESVLEQKFIDALGQLPGARMAPMLVHGKAGYLLTLASEARQAAAWRVEQQVLVGPADGVARETRIDVVLWPARAEDEGNKRPIAVYLDGLQYHHDIVADDVEKRMALLLSKRFWVCSLNWDDLPGPGKTASPHDPDPMRAAGLAPAMGEVFDSLARTAGWPSASALRAGNAWNNLEYLEHLLRTPTFADGAGLQRATLRAVTLLAPVAVKDPALRTSVRQELIDIAPIAVRDRFRLAEATQLPGGLMAALSNALPGMSLAVALPAAALQAGQGGAVAEQVCIHLCFDDRKRELTDDFKAEWRAFWHAANALQFLPGWSMATWSAVASGALDRLWEHAAALGERVDHDPAVVLPTDGWAEVFELSTLSATLLHAVMALQLPVPEVGLDLARDDGEVVVGGDVVELAWSVAHVAILSTAVQAELPPWRFVVAGENLLHDLQALVEGGAF